MKFETGMENNTMSPSDSAECAGCAANPALLDDFKHAIHALGGKWKLEILFALMNRAIRFGALRRSLDGITQHMLTAQLRELERDGLVLRTVLAEKPLRVEYELTDAAYGLLPAFRELLTWSKAYGARGHAAAREATLGAELT
ncbi:helix-turn-helix domain-containing protein [Bradyrhizobium neotropicale]|uniref:winged helix-turn-helix transcriptional regulator n=1 Tax=Bradyrhizobium neotropicale TaxID=1497615 RepID=UPI001AD72094|nr:helix-turn-helix domain-containing protein [Bradyrhizobium neotropicale]